MTITPHNVTTTEARHVRGHAIYCLNKGRMRHVGTVSGAVYEKGLSQAGMLQRPKLSITLGIDELAEAEAAGAKFLRVVRSDANLTHAISLADFRKHGERMDYGCGPQIRVEVHHFETVHTTAPRNPITDAPVQPAQLSLFV